MLKRGAMDLRESIRLFEEGLKTDAQLIEARLGLANAFVLSPSYDAEADRALLYARAKASCRRWLNSVSMLSAPKQPRHLST